MKIKKLFLAVSSFGGLKPSAWPALIAAVVMASGVAQRVTAQTLRLQSAIDGIETLEGCSADDIKNNKATDIGSFPTDDRSKIFFLYNLKTGLLLNAGGYWGTHVSLKETGMPLWVHLDNKGWFHFAQKFDKAGATGGQEGDYLEFDNDKANNCDNGVFVDRSFYYTSSGTTYYIKRGWQLEAVSGKTNVYRLYTYDRNNSYNYASTSNFADYNFNSTKYYLIAFAQQGDVDKNCGAVKTGDSNIADGNDEWKLISYEQIFNLQSNKTHNLNKSLDLTFRLQCPDFARENGALSQWKTSKYGGEGKIRFGLEHYYKTTDGNGTINSSYVDDFNSGLVSSYTFGSQTFQSRDDYERHCGKYYAADIKNARGAIYQDITVKHGGAYVVECKGFSNTTKAKLFAVMLDAAGNVLTNTLHSTVFGQTAYMSDSEKSALRISDQNMDYAAKEFYGNHKYISSVLVQVPEDGGTIRFGIEVGSATDKTPDTAEAEWTVFDDFRLLYASKNTDGDLVLDEDRDNLSYLADCSNTYQNVILHLNKTFTKDRWNGFVLPVSLTRDQLTQAFGPNVRLAQLSKLTDKEIQFESVDVTALANDAVAMQAYAPYLIFPTKHLEQEQSPAYTALLSSTGNTEAKDVHVAIKKNHIDIPNVSLAIGSDNANDLSDMRLADWTTNTTMTVDGNGSTQVEGDGTMTAYGTFARTFGTATQDTSADSDNLGLWTITDKSQIISGRDNLVGSYFFYNGEMWYSSSRPRGLRGFSVWFKPTKTATQTGEARLLLDGVTLDDVAGISHIIGSEDGEGVGSIEGKRCDGIHNLQGQLIRLDTSSLAGLPKGIYVVGGRKIAVK